MLASEMMVSLRFGKEPWRDITLPASEFRQACIDIESEEKAKSVSDASSEKAKSAYDWAAAGASRESEAKAKSDGSSEKAKSASDGKGPCYLQQME